MSAPLVGALLAATIPVAAAVAAWLLEFGWHGAEAAPRARVALADSAFLIEAALVALVAPLVGVKLIESPRRRPAGGLRLAARFLGSIATLVTISALLSLAARGDAANAATIAASHAVLSIAILALAGVGAFCGSIFTDVLDAAAMALVIAVVTAAGVLVAGPAIGFLPPRALDAALQASPLVVAASAAQIDIFRTELLYRLSPLAHIGVSYPSWHAASACYAGVALVCLVTASRRLVWSVRACSGRCMS